MTKNGKPPVLVVVQLSGGNDFLNTLVPYTSEHYYDARPTVVIPQDEVLPINDELAFNPNMAPLKDVYDNGKMAIVQGIGYANSSRSHFRAMDIWHTCEAVNVGTEGWLGRTIRDLDPNKENVLTAVNIGRGLPRAVVAPGVPVASVGDLDNVGLMTSIQESERRDKALDMFKKMYAPAIGTGPVMEYLSQTGSDVHTGADVLKQAPAMYQSDVEYADNSIAKSLKDVARIHLAGLRHAHLLYQSRRIRSPRERETEPSGASARSIRRDSGLLPGPARARRGGRGDDAGLHRVRAQDARQWQRHGPRLRRRRVHHRRARGRRPLWRVPVCRSFPLAVR